MRRLLTGSFLLGLVFLAVFQATKIKEANKKLDRVLSSNKKTKLYMNQQMWLYEAALTADADDPLLHSALTKLKELQEQRRNSVPVDGSTVSVVRIPEILLKEHLNFSWQIHVPEAATVELLAFTGQEEPTTEIAETFGFRRQLPIGTSTVRIQFRQSCDRTWGNSLPEQQRPERNHVVVEARINDDVIWKQTIPARFTILQRVAQFDTPTIVLDEQQWTELLYKPPMRVRLKRVADNGVPNE